MMFQRKDPAQLAAQLTQMKGASSYNESDAKEWKLKLDNAKNGSAVIRFLPGRTPESMPFIKLVNHGFKMNNKWYIENCTSTHGDYESCPVCQYISENDIYNTNNPLYGNIKRKTSFWANILVVKDPAAPENEGKVFKYRFGTKVMDKINGMIEVDEAMGEIPVDVTCPFAGANFVLKVKQVGGFSNYDESKFQAQTEIPNISDPAVQQRLAAEMVDIDALIKPSEFNTFEKNKETFDRVMGTAALGNVAAEAASKADDIAAQLDSFDQAMDNYAADVTKDAGAPVQTQATQPASKDTSLDDLMEGL